MTALKLKEAAPLDRRSLPPEALEAIRVYDEFRLGVDALSERLQAHNKQIALVKEQAAAADIPVLNRDIFRLKATKARHSEPVVSRCRAYIDERTAKPGRRRFVIKQEPR